MRSSLVVLALPVPALAQVFSAVPSWQSADMQYSTGAALVDLNQDGWPDLVVANGNDMARQRVVVYYNDGAGHLQTSPGWQSADIGYHGHLDVADVNGDGWPDVAVSRLLNESGPAAKLYMNQNGTLTALPVWSAPGAAESFGVAFGDVNGDGRPDLAVASGWAYSAPPGRINTVYINSGGMLPGAPSWQTPEPRGFGAALWLDADRDGDLDLGYAGWGTHTSIYRNSGGTLEAQPFYLTTDVPQGFSLMLATADVTGDGIRDLLLADNNQVLAGTGRFRQYTGVAGGSFAPAAAWTFASGYASAVALGDVSGDGRPDLIAGEWWGRARCFLNTGSGFGAAASWTSGGLTTTVEKLVLGDVDRADIREAQFTSPASAGRLIFLPHAPVESIAEARVDGAPLSPDQYTFNREHGWVSVGPAAIAEIAVRYSWSRSLDLAVANWDSNRPNQLYLNQLFPGCYANCDGSTVQPVLNVNDFICFQSRYAAGEPYANCDASTVPPVLNVNDFICFQSRFAAGCP